MKRHKFKHEELYVGYELICITSNKDIVRVGEVYHISNISATKFPNPYSIQNSDTSWFFPIGYTLKEFNKDNPDIVFYPVDLLTDQEKFIFKLAGRLPDGN